MPATSTRPASDRQLAFLRSLVDERRTTDLADRGLDAEIDRALNGDHQIARDLIDRVMATPRDGRIAETTPTARQGTPVRSPSTVNRAGRMLAAGGIEATVTLADGRHVTVVIRTRKRSGRGWANAALGEEGSRTNVSILGSRVGWLAVDAGSLFLTLRTRRDEYVAAVKAVLTYAALGRADYRVQEASRCGRCFRTLTDPVSIDRGIGPECYGRDTGSQHVARERAAEDAARRSIADSYDTLADEQQAADLAEARMNAAVAAGEREEDRRVAENDRQMMALEMAADALAIPVAPAGFVPPAAPALDVARARDLIAEALDAYFGEPELSLALNVFDQLAAR